MFSYATIVALLRLVLRSKDKTGTTTLEYKGLHKLLIEGINDVAPPPAAVTPTNPLGSIPLPNFEGELTASEVAEGMYKGKLPCVKMIKERTKANLMSCKNAAEDCFFRHGFKFGPKPY